MKKISWVILCLFGFLLVGCAQPEVGTKNRPFTMYFVPSVDAETIAVSADQITQFVEKEVSQKLYGKDEGFYIKSSIPTSYVAVVEAFGTGRADFGAINTFSYILAKDIKKYDVEALVNVIRGHGETTYKGQIIARADSGIENIQDLSGKRFAFTDPASTAGFILPSHLLEKENVKIGEATFALKHDNVVTQVYQGQVDAGATYYSPPRRELVEGKEQVTIRDARLRVKTQFPDVEDKVKIVGFTMSTPNEPWVIRKNFVKDPAKEETIKTAIREALLKFARSKEGQESLERLYNISGLAPVDDDVYEGIRNLVLKSNLDIESLLMKKGK